MTRPNAPASTSPKSHAWQGEGVEPEPGSSESPEAAAARAEGNAPLSVAAAVEEDRRDVHADASTRPGTPSHKAGDDAENIEEKRQAAKEAHAELPSRRSPHGKL